MYHGDSHRPNGIFPGKINKGEICRGESEKMRIPENLGMILLAIYLIIEGVLRLTGGGIGVLLGLLAFAAGILLLLQYFRR
jgi:hypothetical protein